MTQAHRNEMITDCLAWYAHNFRLAGQANRLTIAARRQDAADYFLAQAIGWASA
jgi:hypothetical protein